MTAVPKSTQPAIDIPWEDFRQIAHNLVDQLTDQLQQIPKGRVKPHETPTQVRQALNAQAALPESPTAPGPLLEKTTSLLFEHSLFNAHPSFMGYITAGPAPIGILAELLAAAVNPNVGAWNLSPAATEIEAQTVRWLAQFVGYPDTCGGLLTSGGAAANYIGFLAARAAKAGPQIRQSGAASGDAKLRLYASTETHTWVQKAADLFGLGTDAIRWIAVDARQRIEVAALRRQIAKDRLAGDRPFLVIGTAGTVSTGAVDPLQELAQVCREHDLWFHVDGAYGAPAAAVPGADPNLAGLREADSVAVDPHKWFYAPLDAGCALVRNPQALRDAFSYHPPYYRFDEEATNFFDLGFENSRPFRALKVWLALQQAGAAGYREMIARDMELSRRLYRRLNAHPEFEALTQSLSIVTFRWVPDASRELGDEHLNSLNEQLLTRVEQSGRAFLSNAFVDGRFALRSAIVNFRTREEDVDALPEVIAGLAKDLI